MSDTNAEDMPSQGRGPAYPFVPLPKAVERIELIREANMARLALAPMSFYKAWGFGTENGNARQTMAALNQFGLVEYVGRGKDRQVKLSNLAHRIIFDKAPESPERLAAIKEAALAPAIYTKLWEHFGLELPPDYALETFLTRDQSFNDVGAKNVIGGYRSTFEYARLGEPAIMPHEYTSVKTELPMITEPAAARHAPQNAPAVIHSVGMPTATGENDIKVLLDGENLRISAFVDIKGAKKLLKVIQANIALMSDDDD